MEPVATPEARDIMDDCLGTIKTGMARTSLRRGSSVEDSMANVQFTRVKPVMLQKVMDTLAVRNDQLTRKSVCFHESCKRETFVATFVSIVSTSTDVPTPVFTVQDKSVSGSQIPED
ncbi:hypothetical protein CAPTEDRAFT_211461 [Capitella teleta]|uniref:Uncharacterized protein n=1 Tax=Capitella teleta TaxID=283909 RepID=R7U2V5_CAPTE|nr:hypothetical protein CAPTEDRAFT_211461 [Capitella teleta]|eukprot:ELT97996.1 hypothetical protein CAPTEDRAFT_211461 [Capitella teleta]